MTPPPSPVPALRDASSMPDTATIARLGTDDADGVLTPRGLVPDPLERWERPPAVRLVD